MKDARQWFQQGLGARVDALEVAVRTMQSNGPASIDATRQLVRALLAPAEAYGFKDIHAAAQRAASARITELPGAVQTLIGALRKAAARADVPPARVLIVGGKPDFVHRLTGALDSQHREILLADTAEAASAILASQSIAALIVHLALPDTDGRTFLTALREDPRTASIPVLLVARDVSDSVREDSLALKAEGHFETPPDVTRIAAWVAARLRRSHEVVKEARRDSLTGLLNRAAFGNAYQDTVRASEDVQPVSLALIDISLTPADEGPPIDRIPDTILQQIAARFTASLRDTDILARWETAEFVALFPGED
ncbi:MAG: response regulator, partial [Lentisphaerae bacterium]|nr:response regulator [Lentisphaerota bacterium]